MFVIHLNGKNLKTRLLILVIKITQIELLMVGLFVDPNYPNYPNIPTTWAFSKQYPRMG